MASPVDVDAEGAVVMGRITGVHGVRGWVKVYSYARDPLEILDYRPWLVRVQGEWREWEVIEGRAQGRGIVVHLAGVDDRDRAATLVEADIGVRPGQLPRLAPGEYYWSQLEGLRVTNLAGVDLGRVSHLFETGSNDVLVVVGDKERLLPYIPDVVKKVELDAGRLLVDWDADF
jgi:16S rRNA processing protein RimM